MALLERDLVKKEELISVLLDNEFYKMPDGRQLYEATESELMRLISIEAEDESSFTTL